MQIKKVQPAVPRNTDEPTGTAPKVAGADRSFKRRHNATYREINRIIKELDYTTVQVNSRFIVLNQLNVNRRWKLNLETNQAEPYCVKRDLVTNETIYNYDLNADQINRLNEIISSIIDRNFLVNDAGQLVLAQNGRQLWFMSEYVEPAYQQGTAQAMVNMSAQSTAYAATRDSIQTIMFSQPYQRRIGLLAAKEYSVIKGLTDDIKKDLALVLGDGIAIGKSPREISLEIQSRIGVSQSRANRIAQTEVPMALRNARMDEMENANLELFSGTDYVMMIMHMSAFKPTTRATHAARSGTLHTKQEQQEWYTQDGNRYNCYCTGIETLVDRSTGKPVNPGAQQKVVALKRDWQVGMAA